MSSYEPVIGLEVHAERLTKSKMFCGCAVVDSTQAAPNTFTCPICTAMPGVLPVINQRAYAESLRAILRYLGVNSGDMEKGVIRFEANVSVRRVGSNELNTRTEIKNLNSFRALVRAVEHEIERQAKLYARGEKVVQQTL